MTGPAGAGEAPDRAGDRSGDRALALVLGALLAGVLAEFELGGRTFVASWIDLAAAGVALWGIGVAWRRRAVVVDLVLGAYAAFLAVVVAQAVLLDGALDILGGSSRFVTAALVLFGLSQRRPSRWEEPVLGFGAVLGGWVLVRLGIALADPQLTSLYDVKNAIVTPLGASNTLAGYLLVPAVAGAVVATRDRRWWPLAGLATAGVVATLSRGAVGALVVALVVAAAVRAGARVALALAALATLGASLGLLLVVVPDDVPPGPVAAAEEAPILDPVDRDALEPSAEQRITPSADGRLALWRASGRAFVAEPLLGVGLNRITQVTRDLRQPHDHAHNAVLHALAESGLVGTLAYLAIWVALARRLRRALPSATRTGLACGALALALHAQVEALTYQRGIEVVVAVLLVVAGGLPGAGGVDTWPAATLATPTESRPGAGVDAPTRDPARSRRVR